MRGKILPQPFPGRSSDWDLHNTIVNSFESVLEEGRRL